MPPKSRLLETIFLRLEQGIILQELRFLFHELGMDLKGHCHRFKRVYSDGMDAPFSPASDASYFEACSQPHIKEASMTQITVIGLDLAKRVFQVHGADGDGQPVVRRKLRRA
tara:strand:+ start:146 stop:481 length:336 start_codon:yes stop_codon:yes gene_type:complete